MNRLSNATNAARLLLVAMMSAVALALSMTSMAVAQDADLQAEGQKAVQAWVDVVVSGDVERIEALLAPHFQILRADGTAHDKTPTWRAICRAFPTCRR